MPATPRVIEITEEDLQRPVLSSPGLTPQQLEAAFKRTYWGSEIMEIPEPAYLLDDWIPAGSLVFLTGHGNSGKSLLALAWSQAVARGHQWSGKNVNRTGRVLYLTHEGVGSFKHRVLAFQAHRGYEDHTDNFGLRPETLSLGVRTSQNGEVEEGPDWSSLEDLIREAGVVMVVIDPYADYFRPGQENNNDDAKAWVNKARRMLASMGEDAPALVVPAHTSKTNERGGEMRGASALYDGADRVYTITPLFELEDQLGGHTSHGNLLGMKVSCEKSKDGGRPSVWYGRAYEYEVETALGGKSVVVDGISKEEFAELVDESKGRPRPAPSERKNMLLQVVYEEIRRRPGLNWTALRTAEDGGKVFSDYALAAMARDELLEDGKIIKKGALLFPAEQEDPDEL